MSSNIGQFIGLKIELRRNDVFPLGFGRGEIAVECNTVVAVPRGSAAVAVKSFRASGSALILGDVEREDAR